VDANIGENTHTRQRKTYAKLQPADFPRQQRHQYVAIMARINQPDGDQTVVDEEYHCHIPLSVDFVHKGFP
jgi:hypothetical protein